MKKVKLFLTVTTFCLAIASVAATKSNASVSTRCYTQDPLTHKCTVASGIDCDGGPNDCKNGTVQLYHFDANLGCILPCTKN
jgi:hypothetical protein